MTSLLVSSSDLSNLLVVNHWFNKASHRHSPNHNERPDPSDISLLVIHNISLPPTQFGGAYIQQFFCNQLDCSVHPYFQEIAHLQVSAHLLLTREGELFQFVPFDKRAWHAGKSCFGDRQDCNDFSIGIELEGTDDTPYTDEQYTLLAKVTRQLFITYPGMNRERIVGHSDIAPGRKTDPGSAFDWQHYFTLLG